jgi:plasmid stabilization system protein ParE
MTQGFSRHRRSGACVATFTAYEADLVRSLAAQLIELLRNESAAPSIGDPFEQMLDFSGPTSAPDDPVLARLFPNAYPEDQEAAADFRRFTESTLRDGKAAAAASVIDTLEQAGLGDEPESGVFIDVELPPDEAMRWLRSFTDMRLAIATRLGVEEGDEEYWYSLPEDDPRGQVHEIYDWLGFLQETLVESASR